MTEHGEFSHSDEPKNLAKQNVEEPNANLQNSSTGDPELKQFHQDLQTVSIGEYMPVAQGETRHPFNEDLYPQGAVHPKFNKEGRVAKFKYIESKVHGRSIDEKITSGKVLWGGKYECDKFGARDLKGARHERAVIKETKRDPGYSEIRALGLYDETDVTYLIKASEYLRSHGIPTENVGHIYKTDEVIFDGKRMPLKEWAAQNVIYHANKQVAEGKVDPEKLREISDFAFKTEFFQVERELQVSERVRDIAVCMNEKDFVAMIETPLKWINAVGKATNEGIIPGTPRPEPFDIDGYLEAKGPAKEAKKESVKGYLENWLPSQMGTYLARLRKAGVKNDFGHAQQWSLAATMYDGQSFSGKELDGRELKEEDYVESLQEALGVLEEMFNPDPANFIKTEFGDNGETLAHAKEVLLTNYLRELGFPDIENAEKYNYTMLFDNTYYNGYKSTFAYLEPEIYIKALGNLGIEFTEAEKEKLRKKKDTLIAKYSTTDSTNIN